LSRLFSQPGRTDDFRKLGCQLFVVATELDSGKSAPFGSPGLDHVPISEAVKQAPLCRAFIRPRASTVAIMSTAR
jgi:hypothetical protein